MSNPFVKSGNRGVGIQHHQGNKNGAIKRHRDSGATLATKKLKTNNNNSQEDVEELNDQGEEVETQVEHPEFDLATTKQSTLGMLTSWFQSHKFTGIENLEFKPSDNCSNTLGCFAKKDFEIGETIFTVPQSCILGLGSTMDHPIANFIYNEAKKHQCFHRVTIELLIWLVMIDGKYHDHENDDDDDEDDGGDGEFPPIHTYLQSLADPSPSLLHWDPKLLKVLEHTNLGNALDELQKTLKGHAEFLRDLKKWNKRDCERLLPSKYFHYDNLLWACGHYLSRRYPGHFANQIYKDLTIDDNKFSREANMGNIGSLVPLLDILNHSDQHEYLKFEVKNQSLHVICNHAVKSGDELYSNYGALSNEQLLFAFGYATAQNENDVYGVKLKLPSVMPSSAMKKRGSVEAISKVFDFKAGGWEGIPKEIFEALATLTQASDPTYVPSPNEEGIYVNECAILMDYLMASILKMGIAHDGRREILENYGIELDMKFPTDSKDEDGEEDNEEQQELLLDEESLVPHATIKQKQKGSASSASAASSAANAERAKYLAFYLLGQYQILMVAAHDLNEIVGDEDDGEGEEDDDDEEEEEEKTGK